jgi:predicted kinase
VLTVITGPPCGGKTTWVTQHARPDDIVIDFDQIAQALGSQVTHDHSGHLAVVAGKAWYAAVCEAIAQHHQGRRAWIVDTSPSPNRRRQYEAAGARTVTCTAPPEELHRRADTSRPASWHARIDQWIATQDDPRNDPRPRPRTQW